MLRIDSLFAHSIWEEQTRIRDGSGKDGGITERIIDLQCVLKWGRNLYDIDIAFENGLQFKERVEKLTRGAL